jgi:hypothetical protein
MKKYLSGMIALILAIGLSAFTTIKNEKKTLTYTFAIDRIPISETIIEATTYIDGKLVYINWDKIAPLTSCSSGQQRACTIIVDEKYTSILGDEDTRFLNAEDPDGFGMKEAFPTMEASAGFCMAGIQLYLVINPDLGNDIDVRNGSVL